MTVLELWTNVRFMLYPALFVFGLAWGVFMVRQYRTCGQAALAWSAWLGWAVMILGGSGFLALVIARQIGFSSITSMILTIGLAGVTGVVILGTFALWWTAWHDHKS